MDHGLVTKPWMFFFEKSQLYVGHGFTGLAQSHGSVNSHVARWSGEQGFYSSLINLLVLAVLDSGRDLWVQYEDWMDGGVGVGTGRKYRDSNTLHSQAFWYNAMLD